MATGALLAALLVFLGGCPTSTGTDSVTVSGTLSGDYIDIIGNPVITITRGSSSFPVQVTTITSSSTVSGPYSIPNVPVGDYAIEITFTTSLYTLYDIPTYSIDGGTPISIAVPDPAVSDPSYIYTLTVPRITISKATTIDIYLGNNG